MADAADAVADGRRQTPLFTKPFSNDHVIQPDDRSLNVGNVTAKQVAGFHNPAKALGQTRIEGDFTQIVQQPANEGVAGRDETSG